jgi:8-oxo-dGTP diphosphatase
MAHPRHIVTVAGIVRDGERRVLFVRTPRYGWMPPGGQVEEGEDLIVALEREVREESGCTIEVKELVGVRSSLSPPVKVHFIFACRYLAGEPTPSEETPEVGWLSVAEALRRISHKPTRDAFRDGLKSELAYCSYLQDPYRVTRTRLL